MYGGLAVAMPFIHTRPTYFGQIMGELLSWIGEDRILFSSDYALWTDQTARTDGLEPADLPFPSLSGRQETVR